MRLPLAASLLLLLPVCAPPTALRAEEVPARTPAVWVRTTDGAEFRVPELRFTEAEFRWTGEDGARARPLGELIECVVDGAVPEEAPTLPTPAGSPLHVEVELTRGEILRGLLTAGDGEMGFTVRVSSLGDVPVLLERVVAVRFPAAWSGERRPPTLVPSPDGDVFLLAGGDRVEGTLRSVAPRQVTVRTSGGVDRALPVESLLGFALAPLPAEPETGRRVQVMLRDGSRIAGRSLTGSTATALAIATEDGERTVAGTHVAAVAVQGEDAMPLSALAPTAVEVKPYWPDGAPELLPRPVMDRAVTLRSGSPPPLLLGGRFHARGVSMVSGTSVTWPLEAGRWKRFMAAVGVDDGAPGGAVEFEVLLDGRGVWKSGPVRNIPRGEAPVAVPPLDLGDAKTLTLRVHAGPGDDVQDCANWVRAVLVR